MVYSILMSESLSFLLICDIVILTSCSELEDTNINSGDFLVLLKHAREKAEMEMHIKECLKATEI